MLLLGSSSARAQSEGDQPTDEPEQQPTAGYSSGFFIRSADDAFYLRTQARFQLRYSYLSIDEGPDADRTFESAFSVPRARLKLSGHAFSEAWQYTFQVDFGGGFVTLKDFFVDAALGDAEVWLRVGQFKRPYSRQQLTSSGRLELVDRAITNGAFGAGRDLGLMLHGSDDVPGFEWAVGLFNGTGDRSRFSGSGELDAETGEVGVSGSFANVPDRFHPMIVARIGYAYAPEGARFRPYAESDLEGGPARFAVGASVQADLDAPKRDEAAVLTELDYIFKAAGFSHSAAFYVAFRQDPLARSSALPLASWGFHAQLAYVIGGVVQPALRYALVDYDDGHDDRQEITAGLNVFFEGHTILWTSEIGILDEGSGDAARSDVLARTQLQFGF